MGAVGLALVFVAAVTLGADMHTSDAGRTFLLIEEGVRLKAYKDAVGVWTIGAGHTSAAGPPRVVAGMTITSGEVMEILSRDLLTYERAVLDATKGIALKQHEFDALVSLCYNIGPGNFQKSSVLRHLIAKRYQQAGVSFSLWNKAKGRVLSGLTKRRRKERTMFLTGKYTGVTIKGGSAK